MRPWWQQTRYLLSCHGLPNGHSRDAAVMPLLSRWSSYTCITQSSPQASSTRWCECAVLQVIRAVAAAAAQSLQLCPTLCDPRDGSPSGSPVSGILQARTLEWVAISFSNAGKWKVRVKSLSRVRLFTTPWTAAYQAPLSMGFSRQEYWSGVPLLHNHYLQNVGQEQEAVGWKSLTLPSWLICYFPTGRYNLTQGKKTNEMKIRRKNMRYSRFLVLQYVNKIHQKRWSRRCLHNLGFQYVFRRTLCNVSINSLNH